MAASTTALPPLTCTASRHRLQQLLFRSEAGHLWAICFMRPEPGGESAGCVCLQLPCSAGCVPAAIFACHAHCPSQHLAPVQFCFAPVHVASLCFHLFMPCAPGSPFSRAGGLLSVRASSLRATNCPVGSCNTGLQWRPVRRVHCLLFLFPAESMILGHGCSLEYKVKLFVVDTCASPGMSCVLGRQFI